MLKVLPWLLALRIFGKEGLEAELRRSMSQYKQHVLMREELRRSVREYKALEKRHQVDRYIVNLFASGHRENAFLMLGGKVIVLPEFRTIRKNEYHARMILSANRILSTKTNKKHLVSLPNIAYSFIAMATGEPYAWDPRGEYYAEKRAKNYTHKMPIVVISKKNGYKQKGILMPNPYFGTRGDLLSWHRSSRKLLKIVRTKVDWKMRDHRLFWRGDIMNLNVACDLDSGNYLRLQAASLTFEHPNHFDIKCKKCEPHNLSRPYKKNCYASWQTGSSSTTDATVHMLSTTKSARKRIHDPQYRSKSIYAKYRGLLSLPGKISGSYSRSLNDIWSLGSIIFIWQHTFVEFYYPQLRSGSTHLILNKSNALEQVKILQHSNNRSADALIVAARRIAKSVLCASCLAQYIKDVFFTMRQRFNLGLVLDGASALCNAFHEADLDLRQDFVELSLPADDNDKSWLHLEVKKLPPALSCEDLLRDYFKLSQ